MRRIVQAISLAFFCIMLFAGETYFLSLDPLAGLALPLAAREILMPLLPALLVLASALLFGRIFCGWICPMGTTLDALGLFSRFGMRKQRSPKPTSLRYIFLAFILIAALFGLNEAFLGSPLSLTTRLYALIISPKAESALGNFFDTEGHVFATPWFVLLFWGMCVALERIAPRFWCRFLCPAGAIVSLLAQCAPLRLRFNPKICTNCGKCSNICPINMNPRIISASACLICKKCEQICPNKALQFSFGSLDFSFSRRLFCQSLVFGASGTLLAKITKKAPISVVRPPGSIPEQAFLTKCVRCAACMHVCPTGGLQPLGLETGLQSAFSPYLDPKKGPCRPECTACGMICPTSALLPLTATEKKEVKIGTAEIDRTICLAWNDDKRCMVCKENCPYDAIVVETLPKHTAPVPKILERRCFGCGYCEKYCPKTPSAITITPNGELRFAKKKDISIRHVESAPTFEESNGPPPGFLK